jgi:sugar phosphate isomerase/epimerase
MRIGVFSVLFRELAFEAMLDRVVAAELQAVEIGTGGYPGADHCPLDQLLANEEACRAYGRAVETRGLSISALSCQYEPLGPDPGLAAAADELFRKTVRLAAALGVPVVNVVSGTPAGAPGDTCPNWITTPWPPRYRAMLDYQWNEVAIPYWKRAAAFAAEHGVKVAVEMHPGFLVYNVETLLRLRAAAGANLGCNLDPSHLFWNGVDLPAAIKALGQAIFHVHGKDCCLDPRNIAVNGCNDAKPYGLVGERSWTFRTIGYGHDAKVWRDIVSALRTAGYDYVISLEHEDALMAPAEGFAKGVAQLREVVIQERPGELYWL